MCLKLAKLSLFELC